MISATIKTPITYYGGKQQMLRHILPVIPEHNLYCEPFCGGAAVFWSKEKSRVEVINDLNDELINFYHVLQSNFGELQKLVKSTLHSRKVHRNAWDIYTSPTDHDPVTRAWAIWVLSTQSFGSQLSRSWGFDKSKATVARKVQNKKRQFTQELYERIEVTQIECRDALEVIRLYDTPTSFFYVDPPYPNTNQGHYKGYSFDDFEKLLNTLVNIKGKFLLSSYPNDMLDEYVSRHGWIKKTFKMPLCASKKLIKPHKIEALTANYKI